MHPLVEIGLALSLLYAAVGLVFAVAFHLRGLGAMDSAARDAGWFFRTLITPGTIALWPLLLRRWMVVRRKSGNSAEANPFISPEALSRLHERAWWLIFIMAPIILATALLFRPSEESKSELPAVLAPGARE